MSSPPLTREARIYLALWRSAYSKLKCHDELPSLKAPTFSAALSIRSGLYRTVKPYRDGTLFDELLPKACEVLVISTTKNPSPDGTFLVEFKARSSLSSLEAQLADLGLSEAELLTPEEQRAEQSLQKLIGEVDAGPGRSTPFYTREG